MQDAAGIEREIDAAMDSCSLRAVPCPRHEDDSAVLWGFGSAPAGVRISASHKPGYTDLRAGVLNDRRQRALKYLLLRTPYQFPAMKVCFAVRPPYILKYETRRGH